MIYLVGASLVIWLGLIFAHHRFWLCDQKLPRSAVSRSVQPKVTAIIPARNEAETIKACAASILSQNYGGDLRLIIVNDNSDDETAALAGEAVAQGARTGIVLNAPALQSGWSGKLWALSCGIDHAGDESDYYWFSDADIVHGPDVLFDLISKAEGEKRGLVSLMVKLRTKSFFEKLIVPAFIFFFQKLYPFPAVNNKKSSIGGAAGGCVLIKRHALTDIGGLHAIKDRLIDDCALGRAVKDAGYPIWLGHGEDSFSLRGYNDFSSLSQMVTRTAFAQLGYSSLLLLGTILGMFLTYVVPPLSVALGSVWVGVLGLLSWALMCIAYWPTLRLYDLPFIWAIFLPLTALIFEWFTLKSAIAHWRGGHTGWKGRGYASSSDKLNL